MKPQILRVNLLQKQNRIPKQNHFPYRPLKLMKIKGCQIKAGSQKGGITLLTGKLLSGYQKIFNFYIETIMDLTERKVNTEVILSYRVRIILL